MKTLLISNLYPPNALGGYERLCFSVADALRGKGHEIGVLTSSYGGGKQEYSGHQVWRSLIMLATEGNIYQPFSATQDERDAINSHNILELHHVVREFDPDVIFVWNLYFFDASLVKEIENSYGSKVFYFLTDNWLVSFINGKFLGQYFPRAVFGNEEEDAVQNEGGTFDVKGRALFGSEYMRRFYAQAGLNFSSTEVIYNGVYLPDLKGNQIKQRLALLKCGELRLLFAGRVVNLKGVITAIKALPNVIRALPNVKVTLDIVGDCQDQHYLNQLNSYIGEHALDGNIVFREPVSPEALNDLFQDYDIYIFPSLYEPFALTLIFALFAGIPTVASRAGGNSEIVFDGQSGALFKKGSDEELSKSILRLVTNPLERVQIARHARVVAAKFTFKNMIEKVNNSLRRLS